MAARTAFSTSASVLPSALAICASVRPARRRFASCRSEMPSASAMSSKPPTRCGPGPCETVVTVAEPEDAAGLLAPLLDLVGLLLREPAVLDGGVELRVERGAERVPQLVGCRAEAARGVVEDGLFLLLGLVARSRGDRSPGTAGEHGARRDDDGDAIELHAGQSHRRP